MKAARCLIGVALVLPAGPAAAHGLGARYDLPLPLSLYLGAAVAVVALTFAALALFAGGGTARPVGAMAAPARAGLVAPPLPGLELLAWLVRLVSAGLFLLIVAAGFLGSTDPFKNPAPVMVWVIGWVGIAYASALVGPVWRLLNPWDTLFRIAEAVAPDLLRPRLAYPAGWSAWPAVVLFWAFAWCELVWPARDVPAALATLIVLYSLVTWGGMALFGREKWLERGEVFHVAFGLFARFAPAFVTNGRDGETRLGLRVPAAGLLVEAPVAAAIAAFALLMLSSVTFDGFIETPLWFAIAEAGVGWGWVMAVAGALGIQPYTVVATLGLLVFPLIFAGAYLAFSAAMARMAGSESTPVVARRFVLTLVPIAIGYHLAHYLTYLVTAGQFVIPIASDPFGLGWNLFGTRLYLVKIGVIDARLAWYGALFFIVAGHAIAVCLAHIEAERHFRDARRAMRSQWPMLVLMLAYTAVSLWILAQPITEAG